MTVGQLKTLLTTFPNDAEVVMFNDFGEVVELTDYLIHKTYIKDGSRASMTPSGKGDVAVELSPPYIDRVND